MKEERRGLGEWGTEWKVRKAAEQAEKMGSTLGYPTSQPNPQLGFLGLLVSPAGNKDPPPQ